MGALRGVSPLSLSLTLFQLFYQQEGAWFLLVYEQLMVGFACTAMGVVSTSRRTACQQLKLLNVSSTVPLFCKAVVNEKIFNPFNLLLLYTCTGLTLDVPGAN